MKMVLTGNLTFNSLKPCDLSKCTKSEIKAYFENSYDLNESLFTGLKDESTIFKCPDRLRLPLVFYYCHTAVVYVNKMMLAGLIKKRVNTDFEALFETGVDEMSWDDTENYRMGGAFKWPPLPEVVAYRKRVRDLVLQVIDETPLELPVTMESPWWALFMGMEHERIHLETSSVLIRQLPVDLVQCPPGWKYGPEICGQGPDKNSFIHVKHSKTTLGKPKDFPSYGWDNEYGHLECDVPAFKASKYLVTNGEFLEFVKDNGYYNKKYWTEDGWNWVQFRQAKHPTFWVCDARCKVGCGGDLAMCTHCKPLQHNGTNNGVENGHGEGTSLDKFQFKYRAIFDVIDMPMDWPVDVNYHEAKAFCAWKGPGYRLPSEAEHMIMRGPQKPISLGTDCDIIYQDKIPANMNMQYGSSTPVNMFPPTALGFHDVHGNVWEWSEDHFNGYPGQQTHYLYDDFSTPCFDGRHYMIFGGSWISTGDEASRFARFSFRRHFFQHLGFRVVMNDEPTEVPIKLVDTEVFVLGLGVQDKNVTISEDRYINIKWFPSTNKQYHYDSEEWLNRVLFFEYCKEPSFPLKMTNLCVEAARKFKVEMESVAHLGSGTGRASFELTKYFDEVLGIDYGGRFLDFAIDLQKKKKKPFTVESQNGKKKSKCEAILDDNVNVDQVTFKQLTWVPMELGSFNLVLFSHIDRCMNPKAWLKRLWEIIVPDGLVMIVSIDGWNEEELTPELKDHLKCVDTRVMSVEEHGQTRSVAITFWKLKVTV